MRKKIYPCVRCAESTFRKKIAYKLKKWGYNLSDIDESIFYRCDIISVNINGRPGRVGNVRLPHVDNYDRYLCKSISEFLAATKALAIEQGWFKEEAEPVEEMKWKEECPISELPPRLRRLAEYRKNTTNRNSTWGKSPQSVYYFVWADTPERYSFWSDVYLGIAPVNLKEVLDKFEREHPELLNEPKQEAISEKETTTETEEKREVKKWPCVKCTMPEYYELIRRQVMELGWYVKVQSCYIDGDIIIHTNCMGQKRYIGPSCEMADGDYLCPDIDTFLYDCREIAIREGWFKTKPDTEEVEEVQTEPSTPTLADARRQFRELTKLYTVEQLTAPEKPMSWMEYCRLYPGFNDEKVEVRNKIATLEKVVLIYQKWIGDWKPSLNTEYWAIRRVANCLFTVDCQSNRMSLLSFPTRDMAINFLDTFDDLIEEAKDLI